MKKILLSLSILMLIGAGCSQTASQDDKDKIILELQQDVAELKSQTQNTTDTEPIVGIKNTENEPNTTSNESQPEAKVEAEALQAMADEEARLEAEVLQEKADEEARLEAEVLQEKADEEARLEAEALQARADEEARLKVEALQAKADEEAIAKIQEESRVLKLLTNISNELSSNINSLVAELSDIMDQYDALSGQGRGLTVSEVIAQQAKLLSDTNYYSKLEQYNLLLSEREKLSHAVNSLIYSVDNGIPLDYQTRTFLSSYGINTTL